MAINKQQAGLLGSAGLGAGLGAGLMYLLDPQSGRRRRAVAKDKAVHAVKQGGTALGKKSRHLGNRGKGLVMEATSKLRKREEEDLEVPETTENVAAEDTPRTSFVRKAWAPALCTAATAGLAWAGLKNRDKLGSALSTALFARDLSRREEASSSTETEAETAGGAVEIRKTIYVNAPVDRVFELWSDFEGFPRFMENVMEVTDLGQGRSRWVVKGPAGTRVQWNAETTRVEPGKLLAWQSEPGAVVENSGTVRFDRIGEGTRVDIHLSYDPPGGTVGHGVAFFLGDDPKSQMDEDLVRFKALLEEGETAQREEVEQSDYVPVSS
ncbi:MAG TPA: SRPBCC family protein [Thermoanaerobaculia bacterium]|nr:SRPBCC family protein [Thermoanaerobaculia bacterium]